MLPVLEGKRLFLTKLHISKSQKISMFGIVYIKLLINILAIIYKAYMWKVVNVSELEWADYINMIILSGLLIFDTAYTIFMVATYQRLLNFLLVPSTLYQGLTWMIPTLAMAVAFSHTNKKEVSRPWVHPSSRLLVLLDAFSGVGIEFSLLILLQAYFVTKVRRYLMKQRSVRMKIIYYDQYGRPMRSYDYVDNMWLKVGRNVKKGALSA